MKHYSGAVLCGNLFLESDIGGGKNVAPSVVYEKANADKYYTIVMIDPVGLLCMLPSCCMETQACLALAQGAK